MNPKDVEDFEFWYRNEHLSMLSNLPGYRRSLRYKIGPKTELTRDESPPPYLAIHEIDSVDAFGSKEAEAANTTPGSKKHIAESDPFIARGELCEDDNDCDPGLTVVLGQHSNWSMLKGIS